MRNGKIGIALIVFAGWMTGTGVLAQNLTWWQSAPGTWNYNDPNSWNPTYVPGANSNVVFSLNTTNTMQLTANSAAKIFQESGTPTFDLTLDLNGYRLDTGAGGTTYGIRFGLDLASAIDFTVESSQANGVLFINRWRSGNVAASAYQNNTLTGSNVSVIVTSQGIAMNERANGTFRIQDGALLTCTGTLYFAAGDNRNQVAEMWVTDPGSRVIGQNQSRIGLISTNRQLLVVTNGASFETWSTATLAQGGDTVASFTPDSTAKMIVTGSGSVTSNRTLRVSEMAGNATLTKNGYTGTGGGFVVVEQQGKLNIGDLNIGANHRAGNGITNNLAYGEVIVRDTGSVLRVANSALIGRASQGAIYILNGATYYGNGSGHTVLGTPNAESGNYTNLNAYGLLVISNAGSYAELRSLRVGGDTALSYGYGDVIVADNAHLKTMHADGITLRPRSGLTVSDALAESANLIVYSNATVRVELGARDYTTAYIQLSSALTLSEGAKLEVAFLDDFNYAGLGLGDKIRLISYGTLSGGFDGWTDMVTTVSSSGYDFLYNTFDNQVYLEVTAIPEPGTLGLIGAGLGLVAVIRRRRRK